MYEIRETARLTGRQNNNDQLKTNTALQMDTVKIGFKVI
jgi:hypothetical protein